MTCWGKIATSEESAGTRGGECGARIHEGEQEETGGDTESLCEPAERKTHGKLQNGGDDGEGGLRASHEVARHDGHQRRLGDDAAERAEKSEATLQNRREPECSTSFASATTTTLPLTTLAIRIACVTPSASTTGWLRRYAKPSFISAA